MTQVRPFRALRFDPRRVDLARVIAPPYDVVNAEQRRGYWDRDPHNALRLELTREPQEDSDYAEAAQALKSWEREGILRRDSRPALYGLRQRFQGPDGRERVRDGFFALLRLEDYERRIVLPHERTLRAPKADRLKLLRATRANLSSVFFLYQDQEGELDDLLRGRIEGAPAVRDDAGVEQQLAPIEDPGAITRVRAFLAKRPVVIADGHHRYETALAYRDEQRAAAGAREGAEDAPHEWVLGYFANAFAPGSLLLPIHRLVRGPRARLPEDWTTALSGWRLESIALPAPEALPELLRRALEPLRDRHALALDDGSGTLRVASRPADGELTVRVAHEQILAGLLGLDPQAVREGAVGFYKDPVEAARELRSGGGRLALYLNPLTPEDVFRVTRAGELLPQKSTYFYPKIPTGLVFRTLEEPS